MPRHTGSLERYGLGLEVTPGVAVAPKYWIPLYGGSKIADKHEYKNNEGNYGNTAEVSDMQISKRWGEGEFNGKIQLDSVGVELAMLHGVHPTSVQRATTGVYDHTFEMALNTNTPLTATIAENEPNYIGRYAGATIDTWDLETELGNFIERKIAFQSKPSVTAADTPTYTDQEEFLTDMMNIRIAAEGATDLTLDGTTPLKITGFKLGVKKNAELTQLYGSKDVQDPTNKSVAIEGELEMYYDDRAMYTLANNNTAQAMAVSLLNPNKVIGTSGSHNPALRFRLHAVKFQLPERDGDSNELVKQKIPFVALFSTVSSGIMSTRLTNTHAGTNY